MKIWKICYHDDDDFPSVDHVEFVRTNSENPTEVCKLALQEEWGGNTMADMTEEQNVHFRLILVLDPHGQDRKAEVDMHTALGYALIAA